MNTKPIADAGVREVAAGKRFEFGRNWELFLNLLDEERIARACQSLEEMLGAGLAGKSFVDAGAGSGIFSLAARRLGARVHSFDYDSQSVACTRELRHRYYQSDDPRWTVEQGSVLDTGYLKKLGQFDIVYSWGVLHHTGAMWQALGNITELVREGGVLFISIYNDQGRASRRWLKIKQLYNRLPPCLRFLVLWPAAWHFWWRRMLKDLLCGRPFRTWREYKRRRGMSAWRDIVDWVGGLPFEVAKPEQIFDFYRQRGFILERLRTEGGDLGCNEFVFLRGAGPSASEKGWLK